MRIGNPTTTVHFAMKFLNYFGLLRGMVKGVWGGVQMQNLVSNWQKSFVLALTSRRMVFLSLNLAKLKCGFFFLALAFVPGDNFDYFLELIGV